MKKGMTVLEAAKRYHWPRGRMKVCELTLSFSCNARCVFCYGSPEMEARKDSNFLDFGRASRYLMASYKNGARMVQFIGGEPTIYEDLPKLIKLARRIGYPAVQIVSNGLKLSSPAYARELAEAGLNTANLSIHGDNAATHDAMTGIKGSFKKVIAAAENLLEHGVYLNTGTAVTGLNYKNLPALLRMVIGRFGVDSCHVIATHYLGAAYANRKKVKIPYSAQLPYTREAVGVFEELGVRPAFKFLSNYLPCLLPGYQHLMGDWQYPEKDDDLFLPGAVHKDEMYTMITRDLRMKAPSCKGCVYFKVCAGFEKEYFRLYGGAEFKPLKTVPEPIGPRPVYS